MRRMTPDDCVGRSRMQPQTRYSRLWAIALAATLMLVVQCMFAFRAGAQLAPATEAPPSAPAVLPPAARPAASLPSFQATTSLVNLYFVARNARGGLVDNLTAKDCHVYEDNVEQSLQGFAAQPDLPLTLGILLDTSLSQQRVLPVEQQAANTFLRRVLRPRDEAFLLTFDVTVDLLADVTSSPRLLAQALNRAQINAGSGNFANGTLPSIGRVKGTLLDDAVYLASHDLMSRETGRKALILLTDGQDEGSQKNLRTATEAAQKSDAIVYVLLISDPGIYGMIDYSGAGAMRKLAEATGGRMFRIGGNGRKLESAFEQIESELRTQYQASYTPANKTLDGSYRSIRVVCRQAGAPLHVQARQGYYAWAPRAVAEPGSHAAN